MGFSFDIRRSLRRLTSSRNLRLSRSKSLPASTQSHTLQVVVMGAAKVGKSQIISRLVKNTFSTRYNPTIEDMHQQNMAYKELNYKLNIIDTSGSFPFPAMRKLNIENGDVFVLVYSVKDKSSFDEVERLRKEVIEARGPDTSIVIVGNKCDDLVENNRKISEITIDATVQIEWGHHHIYMSAKSNINTRSVFECCIDSINNTILK